MAWIAVIEEEQAGSELKAVYDKIKGKRGKVANIMKIHSLNPKAMLAHSDLYMTIMFKKSGLTREERELIAVVVSAANRCPYCVNHHAEALNHFWQDDEKVKRLLEDYSALELEPKQQTLVQVAEKLTLNPSMVESKDLDKLREHGYSDHEILNINLIISYFNFVNRIALGLGVEFSQEEVAGYQY